MSLIVHPVDSLYPLVLEQGSGDSLTTAACLQSLSSSEPLTSVTNKKYEQSASINITPVIDGSQKSESKAVDITPPPISNIKKEPYLIPLLANDIIDIFHRVSSKFLAGGSYEPAEDDYNCTILTLHFFVDYIDKDTAFQWLVCPNVPLTVKIRVHNRLYLDEKVELVRVFQKCECHPSFDIKVPFIERIIRDFLTKSGVTMQMLKLCRSINDPKQRAELFLNIIDKNKKKCVKDLIDDSQNDEETLDSLLDCLVEQEILDCGSKKGQLLKYLKKSKERTSAHYELSDQKYLPYLTYGFLVQFCLYMEYRLRNLNYICVICGKRTFDNDKKIGKPTICDELSCFTKAMDSEFRVDPLPPSIFSIEIADFLILLVRAAAISTRYNITLDPYPCVVSPCNSEQILIDSHTGTKTENIEAIRQIIEALVSMQSITQYGSDQKFELRSKMELKHVWSFSFFHWLMKTNRYHFSIIPPQYLFQAINTKHQYFIRHENLEKDKRFRELRNNHGTIFAFHGSPQENWHSILRFGLQIGNAQNGTLLHGAAYGPGIYCSPNFAVAAGYCSRMNYYSLSGGSTSDPVADVETPLSTKNWSCIALCEIIDAPDVYKNHHNDIYTVANPDMICTRFIFFFPSYTSRLQVRVDQASEVTIIRNLIRTLNALAS